ncbi:hypothetical protein [Paraburkholderia sp. GAS33]|uniref:hypothetical protein n=1 Tax=Paraburkholderia sp. GAS33 TaxID=3035130 RepID=UPI003D257FEC
MNTARMNLEQTSSKIDTFDRVTKVGAGLGVGGGGISAIFRSGTDLILGFITFGALSYAANQLVSPGPLGDIYGAGLANLDCIEDAGSTAHRTMAPTAADLIQRRASLVNATVALAADVSVAVSQSGYQADVTQANALIATAKAVTRSIDSYLAASEIGEPMVSAVNSTINAVNQQVRAKSPNIDAIVQAGSVFSTLSAASLELKNQGDSARIVVAATAIPDTQAADPPIVQQLKKHEKKLGDVLLGIPTTFDTAPAESITRCQAQFSVDAPLTIEPAGPLDLNAGSAVSLTLSGNSLYRVIWVGDVPGDVDVNIDTDHVKLSAQTGAKEHTYTLKVVDSTGKSSPKLQVNVHAAKDAPAKPSVAARTLPKKPVVTRGVPAAPAPVASGTPAAGGPLAPACRKLPPETC